MSYRVNHAYGELKLKDASAVSEVEKILKESEMFDDFTTYQQIGEFELIMNDSSYSEEDFSDLYLKLIPYLKEGYIEFEGEDSSLFKHVFEDGKWSELRGKIVYDSPFLFCELGEEGRTL